MNLAFLSRLGVPEIILILLVILLLFGAKKLPELARSLGRSMQEFKKGQKEGAEATPEEDKKQDAARKDG